MTTTEASAGGAVLLDPPPTRLASVLELLALLAERDLLVAPHVAARLFCELAGDAETVLEVVPLLSPEQRQGSRALPNPLPLTFSTCAAFDALALEDWERTLLLAASVCSSDVTDVLLRVSGRAMSDLIDGRMSELLWFVAGHYAFVDPRLRIFVHERAGLAERTAVHARLSEACAALGDRQGALWHRSLSSMGGDPSLTAPLIGLAGAASRAGRDAWAFDIAREAVGHARAEDLPRARIAAGMLALGSGLTADACDLLTPVVDGGAAGTAVASAALFVARSLRSGVVPAAEASWSRPQAAGEREWRDWGRLTTALAMLSHERGADADGRRWSAIAAEADAACDADLRLCAAADGYADLLTQGTRADADVDPVFCRILSALELGLGGRTAEGIRLLAADDCADAGDRATRGYACAPVIRAYRAVTEVLLQLWAGDIRAARETLERSALQLPLSLPLAGIAVVVARRVELCESGRCGPLSAALALAVPPAIHHDQLVERGLSAYLSGRPDEAATQMALWIDRRLPGPLLGLPGLDEVGPVECGAFTEPADVTRARTLRAGIRTMRASSWGREYQAAVEGSRGVSSPFERARVEALLGTTCLTRGERGPALRHLRAARSLFAEAGAGAWEAAVTRRLERAGEQIAEVSAVDTAPIRICSADPLAACRAAWEPVLTGRELEVAMLVAEGAANREIAARLHIAVRTVEVHIGRLFAKFDVRSRAELTVLAHRTNQFA